MNKKEISQQADVVHKSRTKRLFGVSLMVLIVVAVAFIIVLQSFNRIQHFIQVDVEQNINTILGHADLSRSLASLELDLDNILVSVVDQPEKLSALREKIMSDFAALNHKLANEVDVGEYEQITSLLKSYHISLESLFAYLTNIKDHVIRIDALNRVKLSHLTDMENNVNRMILDYTLEGKETAGLQQIYSLIPFCNERISDAGMLVRAALTQNNPLFLGSEDENSTDKDKSVIAVIYQLRGILRTFTSAEDEVSSHAKSILSIIPQYVRLILELQKEQEKFADNLVSIDASWNSILKSLSAIDSQTAYKINAMKENIYDRITTVSHVLYITSAIVLAVSLIGWILVRRIGHQMEATATDALTARKELQRSHDELEMKVNERTRELSHAVETLKTEVNERKHAQEELSLSEERYENLFSSMRDVIIVADTERVIMNANQPALRDLFGYELEDIVGLKTQVLYADEDGFMQTGQEIFSKKNIAIGRTLEMSFKKKNGEVFLSELHALKMIDSSGNATGNIGIIRDIRERKKLEDEVQKRHKLESVGVLAGGIAHDFNNLLTAIVNNIHISKMHLDHGSKAYDHLLRAEKVLSKATSLTGQFLVLSKGGDPVKMTSSIVDIIKESAEFTLKGSHTECLYDLPDSLWPAEVDSGQISQVIQNLVLNASQSMPRGGSIWIHAENALMSSGPEFQLKEGKYVKITVRDQGAGIAEESLSKIFDPYFTTKEMGQGLGLAIAYSIVKKHDGQLTVESKLGRGTTFSIYIPATEKKIISEKLYEDKTQEGEGKILLMDDEEMVRKSLGEMISIIGYDVEYAKDGKEAIALYEKAMKSSEPFDAVILDLTVRGGMGGEEAISELVKMDPSIKAIVSSGYYNHPVMANFREYGFTGVISKPYTPVKLTSTLNSLIHQV